MHFQEKKMYSLFSNMDQQMKRVEMSWLTSHTSQLHRKFNMALMQCCLSLPLLPSQAFTVTTYQHQAFSIYLIPLHWTTYITTHANRRVICGCVCQGSLSRDGSLMLKAVCGTCRLGADAVCLSAD